jgi:hypothetical protein
LWGSRNSSLHPDCEAWCGDERAVPILLVG